MSISFGSGPEANDALPHLAEGQISHDQWILIHRYRNLRALVRRCKNLSARSQAEFEESLAQMWAEGVELGLAHYMRVWRQYPDRGRGPLAFGTRVDLPTDTVEHVPPATARDRQRAKDTPAPATGAAMLAAVEQKLDDQITGADEPTELERQLEASLRRLQNT